MKLVFVSNFFNHHQRELSEALWRFTEGSYAFVETAEMDAERRQLGWGEKQRPPYVLSYGEHPMQIQDLIRSADAVLIGHAPNALIRERIRQKKLILRYSERPLKRGDRALYYLPRFLKWHRDNPPFSEIYLLCASAFTARDYAKFGLFRNRAYRWGYFPETRVYDDESALLSRKRNHRILWAGRHLDWKHPDDAIEIAARLSDAGLEFEMEIIGLGPMTETLRERIETRHLKEHVRLLGSMPPEQVRKHMEEAGIFLFTSDRREGWGAVLNEAMNSGCAVVASHAVGSAPFLLEDTKNGLLYHSGDLDALYNQVQKLLEEPQTQRDLGLAAYRTITSLWNADTAAKRLLELCEHLADGAPFECYASGPCSKAEILPDDWM